MPAGNEIVSARVSPVFQLEPLAANGKVPRPGMARWASVGAQPALSVYRTEKRKTVLTTPLPGLAAPDASVNWCLAWLQLKAAAGWTCPTSAHAAARRSAATAGAARRFGRPVSSPGIVQGA